MLKDITLGQYFPGNTPVHRLDPRTKLLLVVVYIVALFLCKWFASYGLMAAFLVAVVVLSRIRPKALLKGLKPLLIIIASSCTGKCSFFSGERRDSRPSVSAIGEVV